MPIQSRNEAIKCITEIAGLTFTELAESDVVFCKLKLCGYYCNFIKKIQELTKGRSLCDEYLNAKRS